MNYFEFTKPENLLQAWDEFRKGKKKRADLQIFERYLEDNLFSLQKTLRIKSYRHGGYHTFFVHDPKKRHIHKASVKDRVVHHLLYKYLYDLFVKGFVYDSYSCRLNKGTHKAVLRLEKFVRIVSKNYTKPCWALKLDIKKFFANVNHQVLMELLRKKVEDGDILWLLEEVISSFCSCHSEGSEEYISFGLRSQDDSCRGIPLGNVTSQVFANIYMNKLDWFAKDNLRVKYYIRYADDFVILSSDIKSLQRLIVPVREFLHDKLKLELHPNKISFRRLEWGLDFLGYTVLPYYVLPRTKNKKRICNKLQDKIGSENFDQSLQSYLGYLSHSNSHKLQEKLKNQLWYNSLYVMENSGK